MGDGLQYLKDRLPGDVTLTNPRHPLVGRVVRAESVHRWNGGVWLVVAHPDGRSARVRVEETDLVGGEKVNGATAPHSGRHRPLCVRLETDNPLSEAIAR